MFETYRLGGLGSMEAVAGAGVDTVVFGDCCSCSGFCCMFVEDGRT
jgi:hypothetical protein